MQGLNGAYGQTPATPPMIDMSQTPPPSPASVGPYTAQAQPMAPARINTPDQTAANAAIFARAKDQVGQTTSGALTGLAGAMAGRGILGSGVEGRGQQNIVTSGQENLGNVSRENAIQNAAIAEQNALAGYQGDVTQRQQDIGLEQSNAANVLGARGQDTTLAEANAANQLGARGQTLGTATTERGQNISLAEQQSQLQLQKQLASQQALTGLLGAYSRIGY
jgi:hypothetical protein